MASSKDNLLPGERELADKFRGFVEPLDKQQETKEDQADILYELGHLYLKYAIEEQDGAKFTKASALLNAALVRTSDDNQVRKIKESLVSLKNAFLEIYFSNELLVPITSSQWEQRLKGNKQNIKRMRQSIENSCSNLKNIMERYDGGSMDRLQIDEVLVNEAQRVSLLVKEETMMLIKMLWEQGLKDAVCKPLCRYSLLGLGSLARQEATPFSDLEFAILVEKDSTEIQEYFRNMTYLFHLNVLDLGETPLPFLAVASLNDYMTPGGNWFYDKVTPSGFKLDGAMPWACKTPVGRPATDTKAPLSLIRTPKEMADLQRVDHDLGQAYHVADVLSQSLLIFGDPELHHIYHHEVESIMESSFDGFRKRGIVNFRADALKQCASINNVRLGYTNAKVFWYRFLSTFVENVRLIYTPSYLGNSQWSTLDHLAREKIISEEGAFNLKVGMAISLAVRLLTYFRNEGQYDSIYLFPNHDEAIKDTSRHTERSPLPEMNYRYSFVRYSQTINGVLGTIGTFFKAGAPLDNLLGEAFMSQSGMTIDAKDESAPLKLKQNFAWAEMNKEIPEVSCGVTCLRNQAVTLDTSQDGATSKLSTVETILQKTDQCICVYTLELHLKIYQYVLMKQAKISGGLPSVKINHVLDMLKRSTNIREGFFLIVGLSGMVSPSTDEKVVADVIDIAENFLNGFDDLPISEKYFIHMLEKQYVHGLILLYRVADQTEKIIATCERWIQKIEKPLRTMEEGTVPTLAFFYNVLSETLFENTTRREEAISMGQKALKIYDVICASTVSIQPLFQTAIALAKMLEGVQCHYEALALLTQYFISGKDSYGFTNDQFIKASCSIISCHINLGNIQQAYDVLEQVHGLVKKETPRLLDIEERFTLASNYTLCYDVLGRIDDLPNAFDFHALLCQVENNKTIRLLEIQSFIMIMAMRVLMLNRNNKKIMMQGMDIYKRAASLGQEPTDLAQLPTHMKNITWIDAFIKLCDMSLVSGIASPERFGIVEFTFNNADDALERMTLRHPADISVVNLCMIYLDYKRCIHYLDWAVNHHERFLIDTITFFQQTQGLIDQECPQSTSALKWLSFAIKVAIEFFSTIPSQRQYMKETVLCRLIRKRKRLVRPYRSVNLYISKKLKTIISYI